MTFSELRAERAIKEWSAIWHERGMDPEVARAGFFQKVIERAIEDGIEHGKKLAKERIACTTK